MDVLSSTIPTKTRIDIGVPVVETADELEGQATRVGLEESLDGVDMAGASYRLEEVLAYGESGGDVAVDPVRRHAVLVALREEDEGLDLVELLEDEEKDLEWKPVHGGRVQLVRCVGEEGGRREEEEEVVGRARESGRRKTQTIS